MGLTNSDLCGYTQFFDRGCHTQIQEMEREGREKEDALTAAEYYVRGGGKKVVDSQHAGAGAGIFVAAALSLVLLCLKDSRWLASEFEAAVSAAVGLDCSHRAAPVRAQMTSLCVGLSVCRFFCLARSLRLSSKASALYNSEVQRHLR